MICDGSNFWLILIENLTTRPHWREVLKYINNKILEDVSFLFDKVLKFYGSYAVYTSEGVLIIAKIQEGENWPP